MKTKMINKKITIPKAPDNLPVIGELDFEVGITYGLTRDEKYRELWMEDGLMKALFYKGNKVCAIGQYKKVKETDYNKSEAFKRGNDSSWIIYGTWYELKGNGVVRSITNYDEYGNTIDVTFVYKKEVITNIHKK